MNKIHILYFDVQFFFPFACMYDSFILKSKKQNIFSVISLNGIENWKIVYVFKF